MATSFLQTTTPPLSICDCKFLPAPRGKVKELRSLFIELQSIWLANGFGVAETVADDRAWELMGEIARMLPRADNPAVTGFDLDSISNDYCLLERLFFNGAIVDIVALQDVATFLEQFKSCDILALHRMDPRAIVFEAENFRRGGDGGE